MRKYHSGEKLQNRELNLVLGNTERRAVPNEAVFVKYYPDFKLCAGKLERKLKFYFIGNILDRDFTNSARLKNKFSKSSYNVMK